MNPTIALLVFVVVGLLMFVAYDRFDRPRRLRRMVDELIVRNRGNHDPRVLEDERNGILTCDDNGFALRKGDEDLRLDWAWIDEIYAFKTDRFTTDLICLEVISHAKKQSVEIHEEMAGYQDALAFFEKRLPGYSNAWFVSVAFPAFAENRTRVWDRLAEPSCGSSGGNNF